MAIVDFVSLPSAPHSARGSTEQVEAAAPPAPAGGFRPSALKAPSSAWLVRLVDQSGANAAAQEAEWLYRTARVTDAALAWRRAISDDADNAALWHNLGVALLKLGRRGEAAGAFECAVHLAPRVAEHRVALAQATLNAAEALRHAAYGIVLADADPRAWLVRALLLQGAQLHADAVVNIERAVAIAPRDALVRVAEAEIRLAGGDVAGAGAAAEIASELASDWPRVVRVREAIVRAASAPA